MSNVATMDAPAENTLFAERTPTDWSSTVMRARVRKRYRSERIFRGIGFMAVSLSVLFLAFLLYDMMSKGLSGFQQTEIAVPVTLDGNALMLSRAQLQGADADTALAGADLEGTVLRGVTAAYGENGQKLISEGAWVRLSEALREDPSLLGKTTTLWLPASSNIDLIAKGKIERERAPDAAAAYDQLGKGGQVRTAFNWAFLTGADSTDPTLVGIWGAFKGSLMTMIVTLVICFPVGVLSALYLEEYAPKNGWTDFIEVSINNLAAVPSIIFGLLGLAVFLNFMHMPRSAPIVGGLTLALMTLPVIVIAGRNAIKSVPPSIRDAALGVGASPVQVVFHHVLPLALPGILTGTIIGMARALGETAPLLMIGMRAFISAPPTGITEPATVLPVQIFLWSDEVSRGFVEKTSAAIIVLLVFLLAMNGLAIYLRNKFERRW